MTSSSPVRTKVFISYSHNDSEFLQRLQVHLSPDVRNKRVDMWDDTAIKSGAKWRAEIDRTMASARVAVLLVSGDFLASEFIARNELAPLLAAAEVEGVTILPVLLEPCRYRNTPLADFQFVNRPLIPLTGMNEVDREETWVQVAEAIENALNTPLPPVSFPSNTPSPSDVQQTQRVQVPLEESGTNTNKEPIWYIPHKRNPLFTGREETLQMLHNALTDSKTAALTQAISGIGKTQTALEYAYRYHDEYRAIFWVRAASREELLADFTQIASIVSVSAPNEQDQQRIVAAVKSWFQSNTSWLLIVDNADDLNMVKEYLPTHTNGYMLLTTRTQAVRSLAHKVELSTLPPDESVRFLLRRAGLMETNDAELEQLDITKRTTAEAIAQALGYLPLALDQAGAHIEETGISLPDYLALYQQERKTLLARRGGLTDDHAPVATTRSLAFDKLTTSNPVAIDLMHLCAFLAPDTIAEEMLTQGAHYVSEDLQQAASTRIGWDDVIRDLGKYSLLSRKAETKTLSLHRLVQSVLYDAMDLATQKRWANVAIEVVSDVFPFEEVAPLKQSQRYISDALTCLEHADQLHIENEEVRYLQYCVAVYFYNRGQYDFAQAFYKRLLSSEERQLGSQHPNTLRTRYNLAVLYAAQGKVEQAQVLLEQVLSNQEQQLGLEHPTLSTRHALASLYMQQEKFERAQVLLEQVLGNLEQLLGPQHPDTLTTRHNLANLYVRQGELEQAQTLYKQVLNSQEQLLGSQHRETPRTRHNLASLYSKQGEVEQAQALYEQVLNNQEQVLGSQHPETLTTSYNLALLYWDQGKIEQAQVLFEQVLHDREQVLGFQHPDTLRTRRVLDKLYKEQGKDEGE